MNDSIIYPPTSREQLKKCIVSHLMNNNSSLLPEDMNDWDVSAVDNMKELFDAFEYDIDLTGNDLNALNELRKKLLNFNENINNWDVSNVKSMESMFCFCQKFNQPLDTWNVSNVVNTCFMFRGCREFNQSLDNWNVSNVKYAYKMFGECEKLNQSFASWIHKFACGDKQCNKSVPTTNYIFSDATLMIQNYPDEVKAFEFDNLLKYSKDYKAKLNADRLSTIGNKKNVVGDTLPIIGNYLGVRPNDAKKIVDEKQYKEEHERPKGGKSKRRRIRRRIRRTRRRIRRS